MATPLATARALHAALEAGRHGEALRALFTEDACTIEHPNLVKPRGGKLPLEEMLTASTAGAGLLSSQRYDVHSAIELDESVVLRLTWTGVVASAVGPFRAGQVLTAHIAQFIKVRDSRVSFIETFDCYEPFA